MQMGRMGSMGGQPMSHGGMPGMSQQPQMSHNYPQGENLVMISRIYKLIGKILKRKKKKSKNKKIKSQ